MPVECELENRDWSDSSLAPYSALPGFRHCLAPTRPLETVQWHICEIRWGENQGRSGSARTHVVGTQSNSTNTQGLELRPVGENQGVVCQLYLNVHVKLKPALIV